MPGLVALLFLVGVVEDDELLAALFGIATYQAFAGQWPVIHDAKISDGFACGLIKYVVVNDAFAEQFHLAIVVLDEKISKVILEFRDLHQEKGRKDQQVPACDPCTLPMHHRQGWHFLPTQEWSG